MARPLRIAALGLILLALLLLSACSTLHSYGIGGAPLLMCRAGEAFIDDKLAGTGDARLSAVRRFKDADALCAR
jgi:hypothetical protein